MLQHVKACSGELKAVVGADPPTLLEGRLPPRVLGLLVEWLTVHREELLDDWQRARTQQPLLPIAPLE